MGLGLGPGPEMIVFFILPLTVHTTPRLVTVQGTGLGTNGLHTHFAVPGPGPIAVPGPVQCA